MSWWVAGSVVVGSVLTSNAAKSAADTQAGAARDAAQLQNEQFKQTREDQMPWLKAGERALTKLEGAVDYTPFGMTQFQQRWGHKSTPTLSTAIKPNAPLNCNLCNRWLV